MSDKNKNIEETQSEDLEFADSESSEIGNENDAGKIDESAISTQKRKPRFVPWMIALVIIAAVALSAALLIGFNRSGNQETADSAGAEEDAHNSGEPQEVKLGPEALNSAGLEIEAVTSRPALAKLFVTGAVELNPEKTEMATPLVGGRIESVYFGVGDYVNRGATLAVISSPQLAQLHGKMHEARTQYELAQRKLTRVQKAENRVLILQSKAKLDEAEATLRRTRRLIELEAGAGKDLIAAETNYKTAKAEYDFQTNIPLNKEIQEAKAEVETSRVDLRHIQDELRSLGVTVNLNEKDNHVKDTSLVAVRAPLSGIITERKFNAGAGINAATPIFAISNLSTVFVIANVPESLVGKLSVGSIAEIRSPSVGTINGVIGYIDPRLDEATRTGRVRIEVPNQNGKLRAGMFTEVGLYSGTSEATGEELYVSNEAIQRIGVKTVVFVPKEKEAGAFEVREIEIGGEIDGYTSVKSGLRLNEKVVTKGSFTLKTQLEKAEMGDDH